MEATHFIEQYQGNATKETYTSQVLPMSILQESLDFTKLSESIYTVCIFKIKYKKP